MLFHSFNNQEERRRFGGSDFLEMQFCQQKNGTSLKTIISPDAIENWHDDSLYVCGDDWKRFYKNYKGVFYDGTYSNLKCGEIDWCGINYYSPEKVEDIVKNIEKNKPEDCEFVLQWLIKAKQYNGIYIIGL